MIGALVLNSGKDNFKIQKKKEKEKALQYINNLKKKEGYIWPCFINLIFKN